MGAAYDAWAFGTRYGDKLRRPPAERTPENKVKAISFAAYAALVDLFPARAADFALQMKELGYAVDGSDTSTPATIGAMVAKAVTDFRHKDRSNPARRLPRHHRLPAGQHPRQGGRPLALAAPAGVPLGDPHGTVQKALTPQWGHHRPVRPELAVRPRRARAAAAAQRRVLHRGHRDPGQGDATSSCSSPWATP